MNAQAKHYQANKQYYAEKRDRYRREMRELVRSFKDDVPCADCRAIYPYYVMDFDHRPGEIKLHEPAKLAQLCNKKKILEELAKCDVVCSNCHRVRTYERLAQVG